LHEVLFKLGKVISEKHDMLQTAFGKDSLAKAQTQKWFSRFKDAHTSMKDKAHCGQPSTHRTDENVESV
jgi:hypothetical protein